MTEDAQTTKSVCECEYPYIGTQPLGEPTRCERCRGLVEDDGPEWTDEQHAAYARASMGEPTNPPAQGGTEPGR